MQSVDHIRGLKSMCLSLDASTIWRIYLLSIMQIKKNLFWFTQNLIFLSITQQKMYFTVY